jgi:hypothetical protein
VRAPPAALLVTVALIGAGCGGDDGSAPSDEAPAQETLDAAAVFVEQLPRGLSYGPPPKGERERLTDVFKKAGMEDVEVRQIRRDDGARAMAIGLVADEAIPMDEVATGAEDGGGEIVTEDIAGVPFHVGVDAHDNFIALRSHDNTALWIYAATRRDARSFARPFAKRLAG